MIYAIHSTLNGIIPLLAVRIKGLMADGKSDSGYYRNLRGKKSAVIKQHFTIGFSLPGYKYLNTHD